MSLVKANSVAKVDGSQETTLDDLFSGRAKAWVNFNGTGAVAVRDSLNVASITDNGTASYTVILSSAFATSNHSVNTGGSRDNDGTDLGRCAVEPNVTAADRFALYTGVFSTANVPEDFTLVCASAHGDF